MNALIRSVLAEPRAPDPPAPGRWDRALITAFLVAAAGEAIFRTDLAVRPLAVVVAALVAPALLWRRLHPLLATAVGFGGALLLQVPMLLGGAPDVGLDSMFVLLVLPYALYRWGSGAEALGGTVLVAVPAGLGLATSETPEEAVGGATVLVAAFALGAAMRFRAEARQREVQQVRASERGELARDLHDTVAHHVSAIVIQAQAGRSVAAHDPAAALAALTLIEAEASRTMSEMRTMVRVLRDGEEIAYAPQRGIGDLDQLTRTSPKVRVHRGDDLEGLPTPVGVAIYRICQESVTNAIRHSPDASAVTVEVTRDRDVVRLRVHDDGGSARPGPGAGYGLVGMAERARLLGGYCEAGPDPAGGWSVEATLPWEMPR